MAGPARPEAQWPYAARKDRGPVPEVLRLSGPGSVTEGEVLELGRELCRQVELGEVHVHHPDRREVGHAVAEGGGGGGGEVAGLHVERSHVVPLVRRQRVLNFGLQTHTKT